MRNRPTRRPSPTDRRMRARVERERQQSRQVRLALTVGGFLLAVMAGVLGFGYYKTYVEPPRALAAQVGEKVYTMGDLVRMVRILDSTANAVGQQTDYATAPFQVLFTMVDNELIRQAAPEYGIRVTPATIDAYVKERFYPKPPEGQAADPAQLEREFKETYRDFLNRAHLTDAEYREVAVIQLYRDAMREQLSKRVPTVADQVEVYWIRLSLEDATAAELVASLRDGRTRWNDAFDQRNTDPVYPSKDEKPGYVGWVPRGAFPRLDPYLYGKDPSKPEDEQNNNKLKLAINAIGDPISTDNGTYILRVVAGPETRPISEKMNRALTDRALDAWIQEKRDEFKVNMVFDNEWYAWVVDQVRRSMPEQQRNKSDAEGQAGQPR